MEKKITLDKVFIGDNVDIKLKDEDRLSNFYYISKNPNSKHFGSQDTDVDVKINLIGKEVDIPIVKNVYNENGEKIQNYTTSINGKNFGDHIWHGKYGQYIDETSGKKKLVYKVGSEGYITYTNEIDNFIVSGYKNNPENGFTLLDDVTLKRGADTTNKKILQVINYNRICDQIVDSSGKQYFPDNEGYIAKDVTKDEQCKITLKRWNNEETITIDTTIPEIKQYDMELLNNDIKIIYNHTYINNAKGKLIIDDNTYIQSNIIYTIFKKLDINFEYEPEIKKYLNVTFEYTDFQDKSTAPSITEVDEGLPPNSPDGKETSDGTKNPDTDLKDGSTSGGDGGSSIGNVLGTAMTSGGTGSAGNVVEYNSSDGVLSILNNCKCSRRKGDIKFNAIGCNERDIYLSQNGAPLWIKSGNNYVKEVIIKDIYNLGHASTFGFTLYTGSNETGCVVQEFKDDTKLKMTDKVTMEKDAAEVEGKQPPTLYKNRSSGFIRIGIPKNDSNFLIKYHITLYYDSNGNNVCDTDNESYVTITIIQSAYDQGWS